MSFGLSGEVASSVMVGGDVVVAWVDKETLKGYAYDYYLGDKSQCSGPTGSCPDSKLAVSPKKNFNPDFYLSKSGILQDNVNNIRLLNAAMVNGYSIVTFQRPLKASDQFDLPILTNQSQAIIWAVGPLNQRDEVSFHSSYLKRKFIIQARPKETSHYYFRGQFCRFRPTRQVELSTSRRRNSGKARGTVESRYYRGRCYCGTNHNFNANKTRRR